ncbi:Serine/arginine repetitive matrix protein [Dorcoceras hygrometricum]|uniref:Serine/arginine repetitive matrix protein n=1 Tax=Dorcoceras hygrometricum TaxID=472368 RepID=A0A2Z7CQ83_9LAMI|nr:Serine/arginine repetitive matrix protein [Dorcoceras hygrometricum]
MIIGARQPSQLGGRHSNPAVTTPMIALDFSGTTHLSTSHNVALNQVINQSITSGSRCMHVCHSEINAQCIQVTVRETEHKSINKTHTANANTAIKINQISQPEIYTCSCIKSVQNCSNSYLQQLKTTSLISPDAASSRFKRTDPPKARRSSTRANQLPHDLGIHGRRLLEISNL